MTLAEKLGQLQQLDGEAKGNYRPEHLEMARKGLLGSTLNVRGAKMTNELQRAALESRLNAIAHYVSPSLERHSEDILFCMSQCFYPYRVCLSACCHCYQFRGHASLFDAILMKRVHTLHLTRCG